jgi:hypothetical protein
MMIDHRLPFVAVTFSNGEEYFFQQDKAAEQVPEWINVYILATARHS